MSDIKVNIVGEFNSKGFKQAEKATDKLDRSFKKLGKTLFGLFAAQQIVNFTRASVKAFAEEDKAVKMLTQSLRNLGLGYNVNAIEEFVSATQAATGVSDSQLRPAMVELIQVTMDAQKATQLLTTAMDLSAGTGVSLDTAVTALTRAYNGNYTTLGKLQRVYTTAQLKAMGFEQSVSALNDAFGGTAAASANSYQGKLDRLNIAFDEAQETIGKGIIDAFERLADGDFDKVLNAIAVSAEKVASLMNSIAFSIQYAKALLKTGWTIGKEEQAQLDMIRQQWTNPIDKSNTAAANRVFLRDMKTQLALQKKIAAERAKNAKLADAEKKNQEALAKAKGAFDLEKIQIEAALKGKITEEERTRLLLMKAIAEENGTAAEQLLKKLKEIQAENEKLSKQLTEFPKANDPFSDWTKSLNAVQLQLSAIQQKKIVVDFIQNFVPSTGGIAMPNNAAANAAAAAAAAAAEAAAEAMKEADALAAAAAKATADAKAAEAAAAAAASKAASDAAAAAAKAQSDAAAAIAKAQADAAAAAAAETAKAQSDALAAIAKAQVDAAAVADAAAAEAAADYQAALAALKATATAPVTAAITPDTVAAVTAAVAAVTSDPAVVSDIVTAALATSNAGVNGAVSLAPIDLIDYSDYSNFFGFDPMGNYTAPVVNVTVEGSVIAESDLVEMITDEIYRIQKTGKRITLSSIGI